MPRILPLLVSIIVSTTVLLPARAQSGATPAFRLIAHPGNAASQLEREFVANAFLKKVTRWNDGLVIRPVDQLSDAATRRQFSEQVLKRSVIAVKNYWQQLIFAGRDIPPPELESDDAVVQYVIKHAGSLGYVSGGANIGHAKVMAVR